MKAKTITKDIKKNIENWLLSIDDLALAKDLEKGVIVTGGCIPSMFLQETVNDYDVYLSSNSLAFRVAAYYAKKSEIEEVQLTVHTGGEVPYQIEISDNAPSDLNQVEIFIPSAGVFKGEPEGDDKYQIAFLSSNAITLTNKLQIILRFTGDAAEIHSNYDFAHATSYWTEETGLVTNTKALECILAKELIYRGSKYPLASIFRTRKFIQRGWRCHVGNYLKMAMQLNDLDLTDIDTLKDQLTGVDSTYLSAMVEALSGKTDITSGYVCKVIDRMLGEADQDED